MAFLLKWFPATWNLLVFSWLTEYIYSVYLRMKYTATISFYTRQKGKLGNENMWRAKSPIKLPEIKLPESLFFPSYILQ